MEATARPEPQITIGQLRQNPTEMIRNVREGEEYVLTDRGTPVARISPVDPQLWVSHDRAQRAFRHRVDPAWAGEVREQREESDMSDPFER